MTTETRQTEEIDQTLKSLPSLPGVYRMLNAKGEVIYVGKASNLKKRVSSYFQKTAHDAKTNALVRQIERIDTTVTHTESEALLLENNLIKKLKPRYNILYRDDKSYPYIYVSTDQMFPRLAFHRGAMSGAGKYFGPYPSAGAVRETLAILQKVFPVRQCSDSFYKNRSRPCLQYQIKRCTAPCVSLVSEAEYGVEVGHVLLFLEGKSHELINELAKEMQQASAQLDYERAAKLRDQISSLRRVQEKQYISKQSGNYDVVVADIQSELGCVQVFKIRNGRNLGNRSYFPKHAHASHPAELLNAFLPQHYLDAKASRHDMPDIIIVPEPITDQAVLEDLLSSHSGKQLQIKSNVKGERRKWLEMAKQNASIAIQSRLATHATLYARFEALQKALALDEVPSRLECFDVSHTMGEETVASCVVFGHEGAIKSDYRRYIIKGVAPGDDYAAMEQALLRRYQKMQAELSTMPDIIFIDGGKGQVTRAQAVMDELQISNLLLIGIAKGPTRKAGMETLILSRDLSGQQHEFILPPNSKALHLIQQIRDEAHRFAITGHRTRRSKKRNRSMLEDIEGLGPKRRQKILSHFGGLQEVSRAGVEDLASVPGISKQLAQKIYNALH